MYLKHIFNRSKWKRGRQEPNCLGSWCLCVLNAVVRWVRRCKPRSLFKEGLDVKTWRVWSENSLKLTAFPWSASVAEPHWLRTHPSWVARWYTGKQSDCQCRRCKRHRFDPWIGKIPCSCLENPMDRNLVGYSPWGQKELDTTKWLTFSVFWLLDNWFVPSILISWLTENKFSVSLDFFNLPAQ